MPVTIWDDAVFTNKSVTPGAPFLNADFLNLFQAALQDTQGLLNSVESDLGALAAVDVLYGGSAGLSSTNVEAALDELDTEKLALAGGTMLGNLLLNADPSAALGAATKQYADLKLPLAGGTLTNFLTLHADPTSALHAVTKQYADAIASGLDIKPSVRLASNTNHALTGLQTVDGVSG